MTLFVVYIKYSVEKEIAHEARGCEPAIKKEEGRRNLSLSPLSIITYQRTPWARGLILVVLVIVRDGRRRELDVRALVLVLVEGRGIQGFLLALLEDLGDVGVEVLVLGVGELDVAVLCACRFRPGSGGR